MTQYTCLDCGAKCAGDDARKAHYRETGHGAYESPVRKIKLTPERLEAFRKYGAIPYTVHLQDGRTMRLFAETARGIPQLGTREGAPERTDDPLKQEATT